MALTRQTSNSNKHRMRDKILKASSQTHPAVVRAFRLLATQLTSSWLRRRLLRLRLRLWLRLFEFFRRYDDHSLVWSPWSVRSRPPRTARSPRATGAPRTAWAPRTTAGEGRLLRGLNAQGCILVRGWQVDVIYSHEQLTQASASRRSCSHALPVTVSKILNKNLIKMLLS